MMRPYHNSPYLSLLPVTYELLFLDSLLHTVLQSCIHHSLIQCSKVIRDFHILQIMLSICTMTINPHFLDSRHTFVLDSTNNLEDRSKKVWIDSPLRNHMINKWQRAINRCIIY